MIYDKNTEWLETLLRNDLAEFQEKSQKDDKNKNDDIAWALLSIVVSLGVALIAETHKLDYLLYLLLIVLIYLFWYYALYKIILLQHVFPFFVKHIWYTIGIKSNIGPYDDLVRNYNYVITSQVFLAYSFLEKGIQAKDASRNEKSKVDISECIFYLKNALKQINGKIFYSNDIIEHVIEYKSESILREVSIPLHRIIETMELTRSILISVINFINSSDMSKLQEYNYCINVFNHISIEINALTGKDTIQKMNIIEKVV